MVSCGCGITMKNAQEAAQHTEVCSEPKIDLGEVQQRLDTGLDYCHAVGYIRVDKSRRRKALLVAR